MNLNEYQKQKQLKREEHDIRSKKYNEITRNKNTFKVYMHVNKQTGKKYIGITCEKINSRWRGGKAYKSNGHFKNAIDKYGWEEGFEHLVLFDNLSQQEAMEKEIELIAKYRNTPEGVYNITDGGEHCFQTPESISKMKETKRKNKTPEHLLRVKLAAQARDFDGQNNPFFGKHHTEQTKKKMSENHWSKRDPERFLNSIVINKKGGENPHAKQVIRISDGKIYSCIKDCYKENNVTKNTITAYCMGRRSVYLYMYKVDYDNLSLDEQLRIQEEVKDFLNNPNKYDKKNKKVICLEDGKIYNGCEECGKHYGISKTLVGSQCRKAHTNAEITRKFMYLKDYWEVING